ncbi:tetratricopeptide repeat protein [Prevotella sp. PINT]|nr:tetratricopeptide repeat protein [Palleniella intestinalis]
MEEMIYNTQDFEESVKVYQSITPLDIEQMEDSVLFDYYYLGGYINRELKNHSKTIEYLSEARKLCETKLGTHTIQYMDSMKGLADVYLEIGDNEKALETFQEAIVKSMAACNYGGQTFGNLIMGIVECYEKFGWFDEIPNHLMDAWSFWTKDEAPLVTYNYYPLWYLEQYYQRYGMYDKAIAVSDKIVDFIISKGGENHPELCHAFYMRGNILRNTDKKEAIATYERAITIANANGNSDSDILGMIYGNLITALADEKEIHRCKNILAAIKEYSTSKNNGRFYADAAYTCALHLGQANCYEDALTFIELIPTDGFSADEQNLINNMRESYQKNREILLKFDDLVNSQKNML